MNIFGFFGAISRNVVKWWQIHITPILRIDNNKTGPDKYEGGDGSLGNQNAVQTDDQLLANQGVQTVTQNDVQNKQAVNQSTEEVSDGGAVDESSADAMAILNRINKEKNEERIHDIEEARKKREEEERVAAIMSSSKVDVGVFIEEGRHKAEETEVSDTVDENKVVSDSSEVSQEDNSATDEQLRRAQEIIDRLNREAAEDEAKKQAEIEAAKEQAKEAGL